MSIQIDARVILLHDGKHCAEQLLKRKPWTSLQEKTNQFSHRNNHTLCVLPTRKKLLKP